MTRLVYLLYAVSGFIALGYQVVWFRVFVERFGSTNLTFVLVITNFIGGLGAGALASERATTALGRRLGLRSPLATCGAIELAIAVSLLLTVGFARLPLPVGDFPYQLSAQRIYEPILAYQLAQGVVAILCVFVPCFFMGMTFPLLCSALPGDERLPSTLYGWNTFGACAGILACEFVFLPRLGYTATLGLLLALNVALATALLLVGRRFPTPAAAVAPARRVAGAPAAYHPTVVVALAVVSGAVSGAIESDMFRRVRFAGGNSDVAMSFVSFWAILAIVLGSWTVRLLRRPRLGVLKAAMVGAVVVYAVTWRWVYDVRDWLGARYLAGLVAALSPEQAAAGTRLHYFTLQGSLPLLLVFVGIFVFPAYYLVAWLLPAVCNRAHADRRHLGLAYGANTLAFCAGMVAFGWIAPSVNVFYALRFSLVFFALAAAFVLAVRASRAVGWPAIAMAAIAVGAAAALTSREFDKAAFHPRSLPARYPVRAMKSNAAHTTYVVEAPSGRQLFFDNHSMSGTSEGDRRYMRLMAHFPLLAHPAPRRVLLICFGVGNTAAAIAAHDDVTAIDVVDLNEKVFETAPEFAATNDRVYGDPRVALIHDDGRSFLDRTTRTYDLVTSEPPPPMNEGVYRLYSREYYAAVLAHLTAEGFMTQWLPTRYMPRAAVEMAVATFVDVFPHAAAFVGQAHHIILVGSRAPIDGATVERRFAAAPGVARDLGQIGVKSPVDLLARLVQTDATLRREYAGGRTISDQRNDLAHVVFRPLDAAVVRYDPVQLLADLDTERLASRSRLQRTVTNFALLKSAVPDFPATSLATARDAPGVVYADVTWPTIERLNQDGVQAAREGRLADALAAFERSLFLAGDQLHVLTAVAMVKSKLGDHDGALAAWRRRDALEPGDPQTRAGIETELAASGP